jgi:arsenate reductase (thioredoxin)
MKKIIFACVHNAGRSQMAAAWFNELANPRLAYAISAGTHPSERVHPEVATAMREVGLDVAKIRPQLLTAAVAHDATMLITMGCGECPALVDARYTDWQLEDPKGKSIERVREIRDDLRERVRQLVTEEGWVRRTQGAGG